MAQDRSSDDDGTVGLTAADKPAHPVSDIVTRTTPAASLDESRPDTQPIDGADDLAFLAPAQAPDELGRLGGYRVLRVLGAGGMGVVLEAEDPKLGRHVAMKVMRPRSAASSRSVERFLREARLAATVEHDHIVPIYFVGEENRVPFIVMPFLKGEPLDARLRREGKLPVAEAVRIARDVAEGLAAAHEAGLVHRDVKPGNLWLEAPRGRVKILDFGLARPGKDETHLTHSGQIIGTPAYMAPEQGRGKAVDARTDLFSLGGVLYRMVTGRQPFNGSDTMSILTSLATDTPDDPAVLNPDVPPALAALIMRLLEKDPVRRPQTAREVIDALSPGVEGLAATVPEAEFAFDVEEVTEEMSPARPRRLGRGGVIGLIAAALFVVGGGGFLGYKLFFETPTGTLVLEIDDPAVEARFKDGEVQILGPDGQVRYRLRPGDRTTDVPAGTYHVQVNGADGVQLNTDEFTMRKAGRVVLRVTLVPAAVPPSAPAARPAAAAEGSPDRRAALAFRPFANSMDLQFPTGGRMRLTTASTVPTTEFTLVAVDFWPGPQLPPTFVRDTFLPMVRDLTGLESVVCLDPTNPITPADLARLAESRAAATLRKLHVTSCELTPDTVETLKKFPRLQELSCSAHTADDALLARLGELPGLNLLWLKGLGKAGKVTAAGTTALAARPLREVALWSGGISDPAVYRPLAAMPGLRTLDLNMTPVGDAGLNELAGCRALTSLRLTGTKVTDTGLTRLYGMRTLALLRLQSTPVTAAGVGALAAALPKCRIESDHGVIDPAAPPAALPAALPAPARPAGPFFTGKDLTGWLPRTAVWRAEAGAIVVAQPRDAPNSRLLESVEAYGDFELAFRVRVKGPGRAGVMVRTEMKLNPGTRNSFSTRGTTWALKQEGNRIADSLTAESASTVTVTPPADLKRDDFNAVVIRCVGRRVTVTVNGKTGIDRPADLRPVGKIVWFLGDGGEEAVFKDIRFTDLTTPAAAPAPAPLFNGEDLTGWGQRGAGWTWADGALVVPDGRSGSRLLYSERPVGDFEMAFKVRMTGPAGHVGVLFRGDAGPTGAVRGPRWLLTDGMTAEALTFETPGRTTDDQKSPRADLRRDGFNHVVLRCVGRRLTVTVNGKVGIDRELDVPATGTVGWLHGGGAGEATFKDIRFVDLTKPAPSFRWRDLFQARPMTGWSPQGLGQWVVRDGVVTGDGANGWLMSDERHKDFELTLEYRLPAGGDGGVFVRAWPAGDITGGEFLEVQLLDDAAPRPRVFRADEKTGGLYGIAGAKTPPKAPAGEWNTLKVRMEGTRIRIAINGTPTVETDLADHRAKAVRIPGVLWEAGQIALQHCNSRVEYRNVQIKPIK